MHRGELKTLRLKTPIREVAVTPIYLRGAAETQSLTMAALTETSNNKSSFSFCLYYATFVLFFVFLFLVPPKKLAKLFERQE